MRGRIVAQLMLAVLAAGCGSTTVQEYTSPEGRYRVQFTGKPKLQENLVPTPIGPVTAKFAINEEWSGTGRMVMYVDYPAHVVQLGNKDAMLDGACQGMVTEAQLTALSKMPISMNGHPGREVNFESQPGRPGAKIAGRARLYLVGNRLYQVFIAGRSGVIQSETIDGFLNSFSLLNQGPGPAEPHVAGSPPALAPPPGGAPSVRWPGPGPNRRPNSAPVPPPGPRRTRTPGPGRRPEPAPVPSPTEMLGFYNIPEPASAAIEADIPGMGSTSPDRAPAEIPGLGRSAAPTASAQGSSIKSFRWVDQDGDMVGGAGADAKADGTKDQHLRLEVDLPPNTIIQLMSITSGASHRWGTQPGERYGPIAIFRRGRPVARSYVAQVGLYSGPQEFDLYLNTEAGIGPGGAFDLELVLVIGGGQVKLTSRCQRPEQAPALLADARPSRPANVAPSPPVTPATPGPGPNAAPEPRPRQEPRPQTETAPQARPVPSDFVPASEVPVFLTPTGGGATILSFDWVDRNDDYVGPDGRQIGPGGGKDEHYRLVMDLPPAAIVEEVMITGGAVRWTTKPLARSWPIAVVANQELKNRRQSLRLGTFSGRWTFDLYAESHETDHPGQAFGVEVVVFIRGARHHLTARCQRR